MCGIHFHGIESAPLSLLLCQTTMFKSGVLSKNTTSVYVNSTYFGSILLSKFFLWTRVEAKQTHDCHVTCVCCVSLLFTASSFAIFYSVSAGGVFFPSLFISWERHLAENPLLWLLCLILCHQGGAAAAAIITVNANCIHEWRHTAAVLCPLISH